MTFPRIYQASATIERQLPAGFVLVSDYTYQRGNHLLRARDINAPVQETGLRPFPEREHRPDRIVGLVARSCSELESEKRSQTAIPVLRTVHALLVARRYRRRLPSASWDEYLGGKPVRRASSREQRQPAAGVGPIQ